MPPITFETLKIKNLANWPGAFLHAHPKLHDQFADMKLHAQNQLYTSISF